jgi:hypothetical protein
MKMQAIHGVVRSLMINIDRLFADKNQNILEKLDNYEKDFPILAKY